MNLKVETWRKSNVGSQHERDAEEDIDDKRKENAALTMFRKDFPGFSFSTSRASA